ncbi:translation initiation factor IF-3 [Ahniella affigens]|uniref:Translation initiation factor IF-3 n=1 Tax=Ahniella affigens TaxID=2021234 RepID=A0A2P1PTE8_9GAMM|nr:translation initiation factor IF-3 [Ahniella affigens]
MSTEKLNRRNNEIRVPRVRLIGPDGEQVGVVSKDEAMRMAADADMDLVEIVPNSDPPVCRVMDFGKFRFEQQKKANAAKKKQKQIEIKELKFRPTTDEGDYQIKLRNLRRFIAEGDKVKINIRFKGRELAHTELGIAMAKRLEEDLKEEVTIEQFPRLEGRQMVMMVAPKRK